MVLCRYFEDEDFQWFSVNTVPYFEDEDFRWGSGCLFFNYFNTPIDITVNTNYYHHEETG